MHPAPRKATHPPNFIRSAMAPVISAGVMMANIIWKAQNAMRGDGQGGGEAEVGVGDVGQAGETEVADEAATARGRRPG